MSIEPIADRARRTPDKAAVILGGSQTILTYAELDAAANRGAHVLRAAGVAAGDAIAMCLENGYGFFNVTWALIRCGAIVVPISARLTAKDLPNLVPADGTVETIGTTS